MSKLFNVKGICELALRKVAEFAPHDMGADADMLRVTMDQFEILAAQVFAVEEPLWVQTEAATISIPANPGAWDFVTAAGSGVIDPNRFQIAKEASLVRDLDAYPTPLEIIDRQTYEKYRSRPFDGIPSCVFIDREELNPRALFDCNIAVTGYSLRLTWYATSPTYAATSGHEFPRFWQRYMSLRLAEDIGTGPVVWLPPQNIATIRQQIKEAKDDLVGGPNRQTHTPTRVRPKDV